jgi:hypothetical protein
MYPPMAGACAAVGFGRLLRSNIDVVCADFISDFAESDDFFEPPMAGDGERDDVRIDDVLFRRSSDRRLNIAD